MANIREELTLVDRFTSAFEKFISFGDRAATQSDAVQSSADRMTDSFSNSGNRAVEAFSKQSDAANRAAKGGLDNLLKKVMAIGAAYLSMRGVGKIFGAGFSNEVSELRLDALLGADGTGAMEWTRKMAGEIGENIDVLSNATSKFMKVTTRPENLEKMTRLVDKLAWFSNEADFGQMADSLQRAFMRGSTGMLASTTGISQQILDRFKVEDFIKSGDVGGALDALDKAAAAAGMTADAYAKMTSSSQAKWNAFSSNIINRAKGAARTFLDSFAPAFDKLNAWMGSDKSERFFKLMSRAAASAGSAIAFLVDKAVQGADWIADNLDVVTKAFTILGIAALIAGAQAFIAWVGATWPILLILGAITLVVFAIHGIVDAMNAAGDTSISATGVIFGAFSVLGAFLWNLFLGLLDLALGVINYMVNPFIRFTNFLGNVFQNPISSIIYLFQGMADGVLAILQKVASAIDFVFGSKLADAVGGWRAGLKDMADAAVAAYAPNENYKNLMDELNLSAEGFGLKRWEYGDAWDTGYSAGEKFESGFNMDNLLNKITGIGGGADFNGFAGIDKIGSVGEVGKIKDSVSLADEDLKMLVDIAEREAVVKINNTILAPNIAANVTNNGEPLDAGKVANAIKVILDEQVAMHTDTSYAYP